MPAARTIAMLVALAVLAGGARAQSPPPTPAPQRYALGDFRMESGATLPGATIRYATWGTLDADRSNAVLVPSAYAGSYQDAAWLIGPGRALDPARYFVVATEMFANGASSSPSNTPPPVGGPDFPRVAIRDNVAAAHRLLSAHLGVRRLRAVVGFSMGAQQAFQWAVSHPDVVDAIVPICGTAKTYAHGAVRLAGLVRALEADPAWAGGRYAAPPVRGLAAFADNWAPWLYSQEWWRRALYKPSYPTADSAVGAFRAAVLTADANDLVSQARTWMAHDVGATSGFGGDAERALRSIRARVLYLPCATDLYFPAADAAYESRFMRRVQLAPIPSLWGHMAGAGVNPADNAFITARIRRFLP